jgi:hypothetical protein
MQRRLEATQIRQISFGKAKPMTRIFSLVFSTQTTIVTYKSHCSSSFESASLQDSNQRQFPWAGLSSFAWSSTMEKTLQMNLECLHLSLFPTKRNKPSKI